VLAVLNDLGIEDLTYWKETGFGVMGDGRLYGLNTPTELLRFDLLPLGDRLRVGLTGVWGRLCSADGLDDVTCEAWLTKLSGHRAFETFWKPMMQAKFGDRYQEVPAMWFWTRFNREKGGKKERKGYIRGGYRRIVDCLASSLEARGCIIHLSAPVEVLDLDDEGRPVVRARGRPAETFDRAVLTSPLFSLRSMVAGGKLASVVERADPGIDMQGVLNAVLMLRRSLSPYYWVATIDPGIPFQGVVETTNLLDRQDTGGAHLVYLVKYLHRSEPEYSRDDADVLREDLAGLHKLFPDLRDDDVIDRFVFRAPFVEPLYTLGYGRRKPPHALVPGRVYLSTSTQVYPNVTSWNGATEVSRTVVDRLLADAGR
jgi:protoporphyrinogen oxidase